MQALGGAVHRGGEPRRSATHDDYVEVMPVVRPERQSDMIGQVTSGGPAQDRCRRDDGGQVLDRDPGDTRERLAGGVVDVEPRVRQLLT